jgi:hypothetical protein
MKIGCTCGIDSRHTCGKKAIRFYRNLGSGRCFCRCNEHIKSVSFRANWQQITEEEFLIDQVSVVMES